MNEQKEKYNSFNFLRISPLRLLFHSVCLCMQVSFLSVKVFYAVLTAPCYLFLKTNLRSDGHFGNYSFYFKFECMDLQIHCQIFHHILLKKIYYLTILEGPYGKHVLLLEPAFVILSVLWYIILFLLFSKCQRSF